jgi:hypothetical protein
MRDVLIIVGDARVTFLLLVRIVWSTSASAENLRV